MPLDPPAPTQLAGLDANQYSSNSFTYPLNLNAPGAGLDHYVIFNINQNNLTQFGTATVNGTAPIAQATINQNSASGNPATAAVASSISTNISRVATTIALYMPNQMDATYEANWTPTPLGAARSLAGQSLSDGVKDFGISAVKTAAQTLSELDNVAAAAGFGYRIAMNNHTEMLFESVNFREFNFEFMFVPQSPAEALNVRNIIQAFKFYWAPEVVAGSVGRFWLYPSEFDISYVSGGAENLWMNKISTCALTSISVNYTPSGTWSALRNLGDNSPGVSTKLTLHFKELEMMQKQRILEGY